MQLEKGLYGFRYNGQDYLLLNHLVSNVSGLGEFIFDFLKDMLELPERLEQLKSNVGKIEKVSYYFEMTQEHFDYIKQYHNEFGLSDEINLTLTDWSGFFSQEEGNIGMYYNGFKYLLDSSNYITMSKEIQYAYILNLDENVFEVYYGNNKHPQSNKGRYANLKHPFMHEDHYGVTLEFTLPFGHIDFNKTLSEHILANN